MNKKTLIITGAILVLAVFSYHAISNDNNDNREKGWTIYKSENLNLEFQYPNNKITVKETNNTIVLEHSVPYKLENYCGERQIDESYETRTKLTDFYLPITILGVDVNTAISDHVPIKESVFKDDNSLKFSSEGGIVERVKVGDSDGFSISIGAEGCGEEIIFVPVDDSKTLKISKVFDDSNYFLSITPDEKKLETQGLIYTNNINKWQDVDRVISSIKTDVE